MSSKRLVAAAAILALMCAGPFVAAAKTSSKSGKPPAKKGPNTTVDPRLTSVEGLYRADTGEAVGVFGYGLDKAGASLDTSLNDDCPQGGARSYFIKGTVVGGAIVGTMQLCTRGREFVEDCGLSSVWETPMRAHVTDQGNTIAGTSRTEWYVPKDESKGPDVNAPHCHWTRDPSGDSDKPFTLIRCGDLAQIDATGAVVSNDAGCKDKSPATSPFHCPDTSAAGDLKKATDKFVTVNNKLAALSKKDPTLAANTNLQKAFTKLSDDVSAVSSGLNALATVQAKCEQARKVLAQIGDFLAAINEVDSAGCHSQALAAGFDHLARSAGTLGTYVAQAAPGTGLGPVFTLLQNDQGFFQTVGGALSQPSGANQLPYIDGYQPSDCQ